MPFRPLYQKHFEIFRFFAFDNNIFVVSIFISPNILKLGQGWVGAFLNGNSSRFCPVSVGNRVSEACLRLQTERNFSLKAAKPPLPCSGGH